MSRCFVYCGAAIALSLAACAASPPARETFAAKRSVIPPGGTWEVVGAAAGGGPVAVSPYLGQRLVLYAAKAGDPAGRTCDQPVYMGWESAPGVVLGAADTSAEPRPVMEITCDGQTFGRFVGMADGSLRTRIDDWVLTLRRVAADTPPLLSLPVPPPLPVAAEAAKKPPAPAEPAHPAKPPPPAEPAHPAKPKANEAAKASADVKPAAAEKPAAADKSTLVYLASYKTEKAARAGWDNLARKAAGLKQRQPAIKPIEMGAKGTWFRLYAQAEDEGERERICTQLGAMVDECGSRRRE